MTVLIFNLLVHKFHLLSFLRLSYTKFFLENNGVVLFKLL